MSDSEDIEVDGFLDTEETVEELMEKEYSPKHEPSDEFFADLQPQSDVREETEDSPASPDERLIKGRGIALTDISSDIGLDEQISREEEVAAAHTDSRFSDPALNAVNKATEKTRAERERAMMDKQELYDLAGEMVEDYFRKNVKTEGIDDERLNRLKFTARRRVAQKLSEE